MTAFTFHAELEAQVSFFRYADECGRCRQARDRPFNDASAFIERVIQQHPARFKQCRDFLRTVAPADLLVVTEGEVDGLSRAESGRKMRQLVVEKRRSLPCAT